jgi:chromate reductase, NAD(P)H dehydrogenase (quinone)
MPISWKRWQAGDDMAKLIGLSGSLRRRPFNTALLRAAAELMPDGAALSVHTVHGIPLYDGDAEAAEDVPRAVTELKEAIAASDGLLLATPEYNNSIPGVLKNAIDWLSRPPSDIKRVFGGKPVAILGATPGGFGTVLSQNAWLPVMRTLGTRLWSDGRLPVSHAGDVFDPSGTIVDEKVTEQLERFVHGFVEFVRGPASIEPVVQE